MNMIYLKLFIRIIFSIILTSCFIIVLALYLYTELNKYHFAIILNSISLNFIILIYIAILLIITKLGLSRSYFEIRKFESSGILYKRFGIKIFKHLLQKGKLSFESRRFELKSKAKERIIEVEKEMEKTEMTHLFTFLLCLVITIIFAIIVDYRFLIWMTFINIVLNLYPVLLQRYNRNRIQKLLIKYSPVVK